MSDFGPRHWQERADEARALAEQMSDASAREKMLQIATSYERMGERAKGGSLPAESKPSAATGEAGARPRVLVVDDNEADRYAITRIITGEGVDVVQAWDYRDALRTLDDGKPLALLVVDLVLPSVTGFALARMARVLRSELKTIYVSAYDVPEGDVGVLRKPVDAEKLLAHVRGALGS